MGLTRSSYMRSMAFQFTNKFIPGSRWVLGSLLFVANKFGDLSLQEPESREFIKSGIDRLPPAPVQVGLINEAQLRHGFTKLGKTDTDSSGDKADHILTISTAITDPIYQLSLEFDSEGDREVFMVGEGEQPAEKTIEEVTREDKEEITLVARLAKEANRGKEAQRLAG
jgi:hypothetical protein